MPERLLITDGFSDEEQAIIDAAYEAALVVIDDPAGVYAAIPAEDRHRYAAQAILAEAKQGKVEPRRLKGAALTALTPLLPSPRSR